MICPNCNYLLVLLEHRRKYKCPKCSKLFKQREIEDGEFREWNKKRREKVEKEVSKGYKKRYKKRYGQENREKLNAYMRKYYRENRKKILAYNKERRERI